MILPSKRYKHAMLDIETLDTSHTAVIIQIALVPFEIETGETSDSIFCTNVSQDSCINFGLTTSEETLNFWREQPKEVWESTQQNPFDLKTALIELSCFWKENLIGKKRRVWSHSTFDIPVIANAYKAVGIKMPWHYRETSDIRTLHYLSGLKKEDIIPTTEDTSMKHNALFDCYQQVNYVSQMYNAVRKNYAEL